MNYTVIDFKTNFRQAERAIKNLEKGNLGEDPDDSFSTIKERLLRKTILNTTHSYSIRKELFSEHLSQLIDYDERIYDLIVRFLKINPAMASSF